MTYTWVNLSEEYVNVNEKLTCCVAEEVQFDELIQWHLPGKKEKYINKSVFKKLHDGYKNI